MLAENLIKSKPKLQERSSCNWVGSKTKREKRNQMAPGTLGESSERGKVPLPQELHSLLGSSTKTGRQLQRLREECSRCLVTGRIERYKDPGHLPAPLSLKRSPAGMGRDCVLKFRLQRTDLRRGVAWLHADS